MDSLPGYGGKGACLINPGDSFQGRFPLYQRIHPEGPIHIHNPRPGKSVQKKVQEGRSQQQEGGKNQEGTGGIRIKKEENQAEEGI